ncbi:MAG: hypothetical protein U1D55_01350 [Phycisphaerae bacterium]
MWSFNAFCDEFSITSKLLLKLELDPSRETLLHFFEQLRRSYPRLTRLRRRGDGALIVDEETPPEEGRRWLRVDANGLKFGHHSPSEAAVISRYAENVLSRAPAHLSLSDLDYDYLDVIFSFDLEYRGNHDELVAETFFADHPLFGLFGDSGKRLIDCQPFVGATLSDDCERQIYLEIKGRTSTYEVRTGEFETLPLSVNLTVRQYWSAARGADLSATHQQLLTIGEQVATARVVPQVVQPLSAAIGGRRD